MLLVGPPGTGKTLLAKAVAGEADASFFSLSGSDFVESLVGVGAARVRDLFRKARKAAPAIIFIDELDAAGRKRGAGIGQGNDEREQTLNQILVEMDGFAGDGGLVVMGATNRPDILDPALLRPGRFDRQVVVDVPDVHGRIEILRLHGGKRPLAPDASLEEVARQTPGFSGAELANVINEAALLSVRDGRGQIDQATLEEAIDRVVAGPAKRHILTEEERWLIAIHEASHAVVTDALGHTASTRKLSIVARGRQLGTAAHMLSDRDQMIMSKPDLQRQLIVITAGLAGERIAFGQVSTSVNDDLHAATALARSMVTSFGMSEALGLVTIGEKGGEVFLGASLQDLGSVGPETLNLIDNEIERLVGDAEARAAAILDRNWSTVEETAHGAARAGDAVGRGARRGALDGPRDDARGAARRAPRLAAALHRARPQGRAVSSADAAPASAAPVALAGARVIALVALVFSTTGLADAARHAVVSAIAGHPVSSKPHAGGVLLLGKNRKFPAAAIPTVKNATRVGGKTAEQLAGTCPPATVDLGSWCLDTAPYPVTNAQAGKNNYIFASKACVAEGGWLPTAAQLLGAANRVKLESTIHDSPADGDDPARPEPRPERPARDDLDARHDRSRLGGGGFEGVSEGATGNPRQGQANPTPLPANPLPESLQYVTVYSNGTKGGFAGSEPVTNPENFRCAFNKTPGALNKSES